MSNLTDRQRLEILAYQQERIIEETTREINWATQRRRQAQERLQQFQNQLSLFPTPETI